MSIVRIIKIHVWFLLFLNLMMAYGCIWIFWRMMPAIDMVTVNNETSITAAMIMSDSLARSSAGLIPEEWAVRRFTRSLAAAENIVTEAGEHEQLNVIRKHFEAAFADSDEDMRIVYAAIRSLESINMKALHDSSIKAERMSESGAWGVVFVSAITFTLGLFFINSINKSILEPLCEMDRTIRDVKSGNIMRRCSVKNTNNGIDHLMGGLNDLLDYYAKCK